MAPVALLPVIELTHLRLHAHALENLEYPGHNACCSATDLSVCAWVQMMYFGYITIFEFTTSYLEISVFIHSAS